jgi:hypothetical protein
MFYRRSKLEKVFNENNISSVVEYIYNIDPTKYRQMKKLNDWFMDNWFQVDLGIGVATPDKEKLNPIFRAMAEMFPDEEGVPAVYRGRNSKSFQQKLSLFLFGVPHSGCEKLGRYRGLLFQEYLKKFKSESATEKFLNTSNQIPIPSSIVNHPFIQDDVAMLSYGTRSWTLNKGTAMHWGWERPSASGSYIDGLLFIYERPSAQDILFPVNTYMQDYEDVSVGDEIPGFDWDEVIMSIKNPKIKSMVLHTGHNQCNYEIELA